MPRFETGDRVMVPVDDPPHLGVNPQYCGQMGTILGDGDEDVVTIEYDFMPGQRQRTHAASLVLIGSESLDEARLQFELTQALSKLALPNGGKHAV